MYKSKEKYNEYMRFYRLNHQELQEKSRQYSQKIRDKNPEKWNEKVKKYYNILKIKNPKKLKEYRQRAMAKQMLSPNFKELQAIRRHINYLSKKRGTHKPCEICNSYKTEIHHQDYNDPYDIIWLCRKHHKRLHQIIKGTNDDPIKNFLNRHLIGNV